MKVSARNQLKGKISNIVVGSVNNEVEITLDGGDKLTTIITKQSSDSLDLAIGKVAYAIIKAPWVVLADPTCKLKFSARNQLAGTIKKFTKGAVNSNVVVETDKGLNIIAVITNESLEEMNISEGKAINAIVKASSIILAVEE